MDIRLGLGLSALLSLGAGCTAEEPGSLGSSGPPEPMPTRMTITVGDDIYTGKRAAKLSVRSGRRDGYFVVLGATDGRGWSLHTTLDLDTVSPDNIRATISHRPGVAIQKSAEPLYLSTSGSVALSVTNGRISGTVTTEPDGLSATIDGEFVVSCTIPTTGQEESGTGAGAYVAADLDSPECEEFRSWR